MTNTCGSYMTSRKILSQTLDFLKILCYSVVDKKNNEGKIMKINAVAPITIQPWPLPVVPPNGNGGIVPPWLIPAPHNGNIGIVPPWLR